MMKSSLRRAFDVGKMVSSIGLKELSTDKVHTRIEQAKTIVHSLGQLKGAAMKAGQILSLDLGDYFPPEAQQILRQLQNSPQIRIPLDVRKVLQEQLPSEVYKNILAIEAEPFAAASIGQAYRAVILDQNTKKEAVFKVQYPFVAGTIESDLKILENLAKSLCFISGRDMNLTPLFQEVKETLKNEADYTLEKDFHSRFQTLLRSKKSLSFNVRTPEIFLDFCTKSILCTSYCPGASLSEWILTNPSSQQRLNMAHTLLDLYISELFDWGLVQTDPNPSNFLVQGQSLTVLDFGATKEYSLEFRRQYLTLSKKIYAGNDQDILNYAIDFKLIDARESKEAQSTFIELLKLGISPLQRASFNFNDDDYFKENSRLSKQLIASLKYSPPPYQLIFLHRKLGGIYSVLRKLSVELEMTPWWERIEQVSLGDA